MLPSTAVMPRSRSVCTSLARHSSWAPSEAYQAWSTYSAAPTRAAMSSSPTPASARASHRRGVTSDLDALRPEPAFHVRANRLEALGRPRLEPADEDGLRVRRAHETPTVAEEDARAVDVDHVVRLLVVLRRPGHDLELLGVRAVDADLRRRDELRHVGEQLGHGLPRLGHD